jgi:hypothetical protein
MIDIVPVAKEPGPAVEDHCATLCSEDLRARQVYDLVKVLSFYRPTIPDIA